MSQIQLSNSGEPQQQRSPIIQISNLQVTFTRRLSLFRRSESIVRAVDNLSLDIYDSEILSLVGESGSGKTTVARCLMGLTVPTGGSIKYQGAEVSKLDRDKRMSYLKSVQIIFQDPFESLYPRFDVYSALSVPIRQLRGEKNSEEIQVIISDLLRDVGLDPEETMHKLPHQLSGGERQRVCIAKALASNPKVLIADEPITMLDASHRLNILNLLLDLKAKRNLTLLLITHDLASAKYMSDRIAVLYRGKLVEIGPTNAILTRPHHPYTELILNSTPRLRRGEKTTVDYTTIIEELSSDRNGCVFFPRCSYSTAECKNIEPMLLEKSKEHLAACHNALNFDPKKQE
ncbi:MAG: ABC transporter ATP-binding protein [Thaumarchaeota archaeon]|nr:ABC transporter ATP-binding protein [Nitrososphaerota archaeon]